MVTGLAARVQGVREAIATACAACGRDPQDVALLPVSKRHPAAAVRAALDLGLSAFGENRVQELAAKAAELAGSGATWHMIGSVQTNKVQQLLRVPDLVLVHSLDRAKLADALQRGRAGAAHRLPVLLQIDATGEAQKHGVAPGEAPALLRHVVTSCPDLELCGVMAMGPLDGDPAPVFAAVARLHEEMRDASGLDLPVRSLGMTGDLDAAIAAGSTLVRVGTGIFGPRP